MQVLRYTFNKVAKWINMQKFKFACQKSFYFNVCYLFLTGNFEKVVQASQVKMAGI